MICGSPLLVAGSCDGYMYIDHVRQIVKTHTEMLFFLQLKFFLWISTILDQT